jgi:hypothetical protein
MQEDREQLRIFFTEDFMKKKKALWVYAALVIGGALWFAGCEAVMEMLGFASVEEADVKDGDAIAVGGGAKDQNPSGSEGDENPLVIDDEKKPQGGEDEKNPRAAKTTGP